MAFETEKPAVAFLSGASGVGKTTIVNRLERCNSNANWIFLHFDAMGIPSFAEMIAQTGSLEKWQEIATHRWIETIANQYRDNDIVVIEGQSNLDFIEDACKKFGITRYLIILVDCDEATMRERLVHARRRPELASEDMSRWARFLRDQARRKNIPIIDTSSQALDGLAATVQQVILAKFEVCGN